VPTSPRTERAYRKTSVSLPAQLYERVEAKSRLAGMPFSTTLAEIVRRALEREDQARLEEALRLDGEANVAFARTAGVVVSGIVARLESPPKP
jgi:predicted DNA-binding protein